MKGVTCVTIAERNANKWLKELGDMHESDEAILSWAQTSVRTVGVGYIDYRLPCERGVWDISDEKGALFPSDSSYNPLLERQYEN